MRKYLANPENRANNQPIMVKYDFKSAFPSILRHVAFKFAMGRFPLLCRYFALTYGQESQVAVTVGGSVEESWCQRMRTAEKSRSNSVFIYKRKRKVSSDHKRSNLSKHLIVVRLLSYIRNYL